MKILVVSSYPPRHCGVGMYARDQVSRLRAAGHEVVVLSPPDGDGDERAEFLGGGAFVSACLLAPRFDRVVVHFQPALYYRPRRALSKIATSRAFLRLARRYGQKLEIVVHEADPPKLWRPDYLLLRSVFGRAGRVSFHTKAEWEALEREYRVKVRGELIPHRVEVAAAVSKAEARRRLGLEDGSGSIFLCAGFLQRSKGFDRAVEALAASRTNGARLYIVGSVRDQTPEGEAYLRELRERCAGVPGVRLVERFLSDEEFDLWVAAADWLVLPYRRSWSSGVLARAHALGTPAIVSRVGGLPEQAGDQDVVFENDDGLRAALLAAAGGAGAPSARRGTADARNEAVAERGRRIEPPGEKKGRGMLFASILLSVALAAAAQLTLKHGMSVVTSHGTVPLDLKQPVDTVRRIAANASVWAGLLTFVLSAAVWLVVLSRASLSFAYPFVSITYVVILLFDGLVLHEPVSGVRWAGVALIVAGILLISRTHQTA